MNVYHEYFTFRKPSNYGAYLTRFWHKGMLKQVSKLIPDFFNKKILEIGAGHGYFAECCREIAMEYCGYEMNAEQALTLKNAGYNISVATIPPLTIPEKVNVVWISHMLEHARHYRHAQAMLRACYNGLEKNSYVVVIAPDLLHWGNFFWACDWSHGFPTTINNVSQLFAEAGFEIHAAKHHTATITNPLFAWLMSRICKLLPVGLFDFICEKMTGRKLFSSFMSIYGYRQIMIIGKKV